jgi:hypothetical protein
MDDKRDLLSFEIDEMAFVQVRSARSGKLKIVKLLVKIRNKLG